MTTRSPKHLRAVTMPGQVAAEIRRMIARGQLREGEWLPPEAELIAQYGVSRPTLREALRLLQADSLIVVRRGPPGGARVTIPGPDAAADLFGMLLTLSHTTIGDVWDARLTIEPAAARRLAAGATAQHLAALDAELDQVRSAAAYPELLNAAGVRFHCKLVELSGNRTLSTVIGMLSEIIARELAKTLTQTDDADAIARAGRRAVRGYEKITEAVHRGDPALAEKTWRDHLISARRFLRKNRGDDRVVDLLY